MYQPEFMACGKSLQQKFVTFLNKYGWVAPMVAGKGARPTLFKSRVGLIIGLAAVVFVLVYGLWSGPYSQDPAYHAFADQRSCGGIPNFLNVISNIPFIFIGLAGLWWLGRAHAPGRGGSFCEPGERKPYVLLFLSVCLTGLGSAYYHLDPDNDRLMWDRLPMALAFMSLFAAMIAERMSVPFGVVLLGPLIAVGTGSVLYWHVSELEHRGDLRPYVLVQFYPLLAIPVMLLIFPPRYTRTADLFVVLGWYVLAKVFELCDGPIYQALGGWVSGHTLKHLASATGAFWLLRMLHKRRPRLQTPDREVP